MSAVLVYLDRHTNQVIRINPNTRLIPANIDETTFIYSDTNFMPKEIVDERAWDKLEFVFQIGKFKTHDAVIDTGRIQRLNTLLECIERFQGMINRIRINQTPNAMLGAAELSVLYQREIDDYNSSGSIGPLLASKVNDDTSVEEVVAEYTLKNESYESSLIRTEVILNEYLPKIKSSPAPYSVLAELVKKYGANLK
jgi:hypothetical protein